MVRIVATALACLRSRPFEKIVGYVRVICIRPDASLFDTSTPAAFTRREATRETCTTAYTSTSGIVHLWSRVSSLRCSVYQPLNTEVLLPLTRRNFPPS